jgi:hypothetical protein
MKIRIAAQKAPRTPGTRCTSIVVLNLRRPLEVFEARVDLEALKTTVSVWVSRLTPDERGEARFRVYALVLGRAGGTRRKSLGDWLPNEPLDPFIEAVRRRFAAIPTDQASLQPLSREAWVDEQELLPVRTTNTARGAAGRRTKA